MLLFQYSSIYWTRARQRCCTSTPQCQKLVCSLTLRPLVYWGTHIHAKMLAPMLSPNVFVRLGWRPGLCRFRCNLLWCTQPLRWNPNQHCCVFNQIQHKIISRDKKPWDEMTSEPTRPFFNWCAICKMAGFKGFPSSSILHKTKICGRQFFASCNCESVSERLRRVLIAYPSRFLTSNDSTPRVKVHEKRDPPNINHRFSVQRHLFVQALASIDWISYRL